MPQDPSALNLNPEAVSRLLHEEASGNIPELWKPHIEKLRANGVLPPPMIGGADTGAMRQYKPPTVQPPEPSMMDNIASKIPSVDEAVGGFKKGMAWGAENVGKPAVEAFADPEALTGMAAGYATKGLPWYIGMPVAGAATGATRLASEAVSAAREGRSAATPGMGKRVASAALSGAMGEGTSRVMGKMGRADMDPAAKEAIDFYGRENVGVHQMTDATPIHVAANIAQYGPGGKGIMQRAQMKRSGMLQDTLINEAEKLPSTPGNLTGRTLTPSGYNPAAPGIEAQDNIKNQLKNMRSSSGFDEFLNDYGDMQAVNPVTGEPYGPQVSQLLHQRSAALKAARQAERSGPEGAAAQQSFLDRAAKIDNRIKGIIPPHAHQEFKNITSKYASEMERLDNDTVYNIRKETKSDLVMNKVLTNQLKGYSPRGLGRAASNEELLGKLRSSLTPDGWQQLQADATYELTRDAVDPKTGLMDYDRMEKIFGGLSDNTAQKLFHTATPQIRKTLRLLKREEDKTEMGRLFIAIRGPAAAMQVGSGLIGLAGGAAAHSVSTAVSGAAILLTPYVFAKALNSNLGRKMLIRVATSPTGAPQKKAAGILTRWATQVAAEEGREQMVEDEKPNPAETIPEPPK